MKIKKKSILILNLFLISFYIEAQDQNNTQDNIEDNNTEFLVGEIESPAEESFNISPEAKPEENYTSVQVESAENIDKLESKEKIKSEIEESYKDLAGLLEDFDLLSDIEKEINLKDTD